MSECLFLHNYILFYLHKHELCVTFYFLVCIYCYNIHYMYNNCIMNKSIRPFPLSIRAAILFFVILRSLHRGRFVHRTVRAGCARAAPAARTCAAHRHTTHIRLNTLKLHCLYIYFKNLQLRSNAMFCICGINCIYYWIYLTMTNCHSLFRISCQ